MSREVRSAAAACCRFLHRPNICHAEPAGSIGQVDAPICNGAGHEAASLAVMRTELSFPQPSVAMEPRHCLDNTPLSNEGSARFIGTDASGAPLAMHQINTVSEGAGGFQVMNRHSSIGGFRVENRHSGDDVMNIILPHDDSMSTTTTPRPAADVSRAVVPPQHTPPARSRFCVSDEVKRQRSQSSAGISCSVSRDDGDGSPLLGSPISGTPLTPGERWLGPSGGGDDDGTSVDVRRLAAASDALSSPSRHFSRALPQPSCISERVSFATSEELLQSITMTEEEEMRIWRTQESRPKNGVVMSLTSISGDLSVYSPGAVSSSHWELRATSAPLMTWPWVRLELAAAAGILCPSISAPATDASAGTHMRDGSEWAAVAPEATLGDADLRGALRQKGMAPGQRTASGPSSLPHASLPSAALSSRAPHLSCSHRRLNPTSFNTAARLAQRTPLSSQQAPVYTGSKQACKPPQSGPSHRAPQITAWNHTRTLQKTTCALQRKSSSAGPSPSSSQQTAVTLVARPPSATSIAPPSAPAAVPSYKTVPAASSFLLKGGGSRQPVASVPPSSAPITRPRARKDAVNILPTTVPVAYPRTGREAAHVQQPFPPPLRSSSTRQRPAATSNSTVQRPPPPEPPAAPSGEAAVGKRRGPGRASPWNLRGGGPAVAAPDYAVETQGRSGKLLHPPITQCLSLIHISEPTRPY